jgi:hypothetical protein
MLRSWPAFVEASLHQLIAAARLPNSGICEIAVNASLAFIEGAKPRDEIECALVIQMACTHSAASRGVRVLLPEQAGASRLDAGAGPAPCQPDLPARNRGDRDPAAEGVGRACFSRQRPGGPDLERGARSRIRRYGPLPIEPTRAPRRPFSAWREMCCPMRQRTPVGSTSTKSRIPQGRSSGGSVFVSYLDAIP